MKNFIVGLLTLLIPVSLWAQTTEYGDFKIINTEIVFQKVFTRDSITLEKLSEFLKTVPNVSNAQVVNNAVQGDLSDFVVDYKKFQFKQVAVPPIIQTGRYSGKIVIEGKGNKYRITINSIQMKGDMGYKKIASPESLTNYACTNSGTVISRDWCKPNTLGLLGTALTDRLQYVNKKDSEF